MSDLGFHRVRRRLRGPGHGKPLNRVQMRTFEANCIDKYFFALKQPGYLIFFSFFNNHFKNNPLFLHKNQKMYTVQAKLLRILANNSDLVPIYCTQYT